MEGQILVVDKYQAPRVDGKYDLKNARLIRPGMKVPAGYVEDVNESTEANGMFLKVDEKATKERDEKVAENLEAKKAKAEAKTLTADSLVDALVNVGKKEPKAKAKAEAKTDE